MKNQHVKYWIFVYCLMLSVQLSAQSFISEGKQWRYSIQICESGILGHKCNYKNYAYKFQGDSVINDTIYTKLLKSDNESLLNWKLSCLWRETDDKKVYIRTQKNYPPYKNEKLMYDFSLIKNDTFINDDITYYVDSVKDIMWAGKIRKHWYLNIYHAKNDSANGGYSALWIEGLGQAEYFLDNVGGLVGAFQFLLCFQENGQQVYQNPKFNTCFYTSASILPTPDKPFKIYPNPVSEKLFVQVNQLFKEDLSVELYSASGQLVKTDCLDAQASLYQIDVSTIRSGIYVVRLLSASVKYTEEIIIKN